jgi:acyl transferase domain-containing protein/NAD(P)-dependent dehydrogenase (short-subunit alcohol dehydrogenase family)/NAD(P)H-dependent flavin oxidoreductase YrpB (nitropropane dioxygenase family)
MTRVSDRADFALQVAQEGALPFLALALMRAQEVDALLAETQQLLDKRPWGVGILGFVPLELRQEQLEVIRRYRPHFALIAGGRPDQARLLEQDGIATYLHVPSPGLLRLFMEDGARRFVFEGCECGGHVGPRSSFTLWNAMIETLLELLPEVQEADCHVLFAGGIHDALSASMVSVLAAPLAERGVRVGVLLGTAYIFTQEAVTSGAILLGFQEEALRCQRTVLLETGPGHATRCALNPYSEQFEQEKQRLTLEGTSPSEIRQQLEEMNIGRLRIASKGIVRNAPVEPGSEGPRFITVDDEEQRRQGMYMIGQLSALRDRTCTVAELHDDIAVEGSKRLKSLPTAFSRASASLPKAQPAEIAIVGMSCILPKAQEPQTYWENILNKVSAITEIPKDRWDWELYYDPDRHVRDKIYSMWGGFLDDVTFDPVEFGIPPNSLPAIDPMQLLALKAAREVLSDAGYLNRSFDRSRTSVVLGLSGGTGDLGAAYLLRSSLPLLFGKGASDIISKVDGYLPEWTEDSFAGLLLNVVAGRIANRFDLGGLNYIVDAACASSLAAVYHAVRELETHNTDMVIAGGVDTVQNPFGYLCFSKTQALSPTGEPRTFDASADGIVISEGLVMLALKRLADAERDGDRIYAVIQSVGGSSDGRAKGLTAPRPEGQMLALQRAYAKAGISPTTVGLFEAHGTGTVVGDRTEALSLSTFLEASGAKPQSCAIGSVKSMIGHTKATAGVAGLMKVALALYHKVLPPTLGVTQPNPNARFQEGPLYVNTETRPWIHSTHQHPRRAGVSAFGFGGTNFHAVVEEYQGDFLPKPAVTHHWPSELFLWSVSSRQDLLMALTSLEQALDRGANPRLHDLAYTLWQDIVQRPTPTDDTDLRLAIVANSAADLQHKLAQARQALITSEVDQVKDPRGIYFSEAPLAKAGKVVFLFPGQGSQYPNMMRDLAVHFSPVRQVFEQLDAVLAQRYPQPLSRYIFTPPVFSPEEERAYQQALTQTHVAQPSLGAADMALFWLLQSLGVQPELVAGHSYGEYVALCAAGVFNEETLAVLSEARGRCIIEAAQQDLGTMAAVQARSDSIAEVLDGLADVWISNLNAPEQTIISGTRTGVEQAIERLKSQEISVRSMSVACAFHSPIVAPAQERLSQELSAHQFAKPQLEVFSNTTAAPYPCDSQAIASRLAEHLVKPVRFAEEIEAMYEAGGRIFVEVGPRNVLTGLVQQTLGERPHIALAVDTPGRPGLTQLQHALAHLAAHGVSVRLEPLFQDRLVQRLNLDTLEEENGQQPLAPTTWLVNGGQARPLGQPSGVAPRPILLLPEAHPAYLNGHTEAMTTEAMTKATVPQMKSSAAEQQRNSAPGGQIPSGPSISLPMPTPAPAPPRDVGTRIPSGSAVGQVMMQFQHLMDQFLETQRDVMLTYLQGAPDRTAQAGETQPWKTTLDVQAPPLTPWDIQPEAPDVHHPTPILQVSQPVSDPMVASASEDLSAETSAALGGRELLTQQLLQLLSEHTGYPADMLDLDVDIEADLGIDSIKRIEVLGALQRLCMSPGCKVGQDAMEQLTGIKSLRGIVDWFEQALPPRGTARHGDSIAIEQPEIMGRESQATVAYTHRENGPEAGREVHILRSTLVAVDAPPVDRPSLQIAPDTVFLITDDGHGIAQAVAQRVCVNGGRVALVRQHSGLSLTDEGVYRADLSDPDTVTELVAMIRQQQGPIAGLVHLLPLGNHLDVGEMNLTTWRNQLRCDVKSLFYLAKAAAVDIKQSAAVNGGWLLAATAMGGAGALDADRPQSFFPGQGGVAGLVKSLALEWPTVQCKVVDLDLENPAATVAEQVVCEMAAGDGQVEMGYQGLCRQLFQPRLLPVDHNRPLHMAIDSDWVVLVTGGARGITAEVACELAERYQPTLLLVGRSAWPQEESALTAGRMTPQELKAALLEQMRQEDEKVSPSRVETAYNRLLQDREMRRNLAIMQRTGATVRYYQADVYNEQAMVELIDGIYQDYGHLDGVIHGAGVIEDKLIEDKTPASFDRVFDTKADSAFILAHALRAEPLKFLAMFSSAAGTFGNRGQCDYAAANEILNKLAIQLDKTWPGRVVSMSWGPWAKTGMVSTALQQEFARRGVEIITIPTGCRLFVEELQYGDKGEASVILAGGTWGGLQPSKGAITAQTFPLLEQATSVNGHNGYVEIIRTLEPSHDLYLQDHQLDDRPVLPLAMAMELMAEVVQQGWPDRVVIGLRDLQVLRGVVLENGPKTVQLVVREPEVAPEAQLRVDVHVQIIDPARPEHPYYRAVVELGDGWPELPSYQLPDVKDLQPFPMTVDDAYHQWLFHGPLFHGIAAIEGFDDRGMSAILTPSSPQQCLQGNGEGAWLIDPVVLDSGLQLSILWARMRTDMTPLPARFQRYRRFGLLTGEEIRCQMLVDPTQQGQILHFNFFFFSLDNQLLGVLEGLQCPISQALNRLAGGQRRKV